MKIRGNIPIEQAQLVVHYVMQQTKNLSSAGRIVYNMAEKTTEETGVERGIL